MIASFADKATGDVFHGTDTREARTIPKEVWTVARRKLDSINAAHVLQDLKSPPGNRLEKLRGDLAGRYSIRINERFRLVFRYDGGQASEVRITDYHK